MITSLVWRGWYLCLWHPGIWLLGFHSWKKQAGHMRKSLARAESCFATLLCSQSSLGTIETFHFLAKREQERLPGAIFRFSAHTVWISNQASLCVGGWREEANKDTYVYMALHLYWKSVRFRAQLLLMQLWKDSSGSLELNYY